MSEVSTKSRRTTISEPSAADSVAQLRSLQRLSNQIASKIGELLVDQATRNGNNAKVSFEEARPKDAELFTIWLKNKYELRKRRGSFVVYGDLLGEPTWDIVLDLAYNRLIGKKVSVKAACLASHCPPSTALRYISKLTELKVVTKRGDPTDGRREFLEISDSALSDLYRIFLYNRSLFSGISHENYLID